MKKKKNIRVYNNKKNTKSIQKTARKKRINNTEQEGQIEGPY